MSVNIDVHLNNPEKVEVRTEIYSTEEHGEFAVFAVDEGNDTVKFYTHKLSDLETMAFHLGALIQELRDEHGWTN